MYVWMDGWMDVALARAARRGEARRRERKSRGQVTSPNALHTSQIRRELPLLLLGGLGCVRVTFPTVGRRLG
jgi:hypothetical protein